MYITFQYVKLTFSVAMSVLMSALMDITNQQTQQSQCHSAQPGRRRGCKRHIRRFPF